MMDLDEDRAIADLRRLASFGKYETGVNRPALSDADFAARLWLKDQMREAGLEVDIDGLGTVIGRAPCARATLLLGSHSDSVPFGGWLDGALGVIFALAVARARQRTHPEDAIGVDVVSFADEEGTFLACGGSRAFCGEIGREAFEGARNAAGETGLDRLNALALSGRPLFALDPVRQRAFLEAHIEQGPRLIEAGLNVGAVTGIVGIRRRRVRFGGRADHAGTTPMSLREDAAKAMYAFAVAAEAALSKASSAHSVWNLGIVNVRPGAPNVVAHEAEIVVEFRDLSTEVMERMDAALLALIAERDGVEGVRAASERIAAIDPTHMNEGMIARLEAAAKAEGASCVRMQSGAGHDAMILGRRIPAAMLFVPSLGGRSHHISEDTDEADIRRGLRVYARAADFLLGALEANGGSAP